MRGALQVKVLSSHLEVLQELKEQVESLLPYISNSIQKGTAWIEETENESFMEISQYLTNEISQSMRKCFNISNDKNFEKVVQQIEELNRNISSLSKKMKRIEQKFKKQEKHNELMKKEKEELENKTNLKFEEIVQELHEASDFMSNLQTEHESMSKHLEENEKEMKRFIDNLNVKRKIEHQDEKTEIIVHPQLENNVILKLDQVSRELLDTNGRIDRISSLVETLPNHVSENEHRFKELQLKVKDQEDRFVEVDTFQKERNDKINLKIGEIVQTVLNSKELIKDVQSNSKTLFSEMECLKIDLKDTKLYIDPIKNRVLEIVNELTAFKSCSEKVNGTENKVELERRLAELALQTFNITSQVDKMSQEITDMNKSKKFVFNYSKKKKTKLLITVYRCKIHF